MSWLFASGGQSIGASASASVLPENIQDWFPLISNEQKCPINLLQNFIAYYLARKCTIWHKNVQKGNHVKLWKQTLSNTNPGQNFIHYLLYILLLFTHPIMSDSLQPYGLQYTRIPYPSLSLRVCSNACPLSCWCHPTTSFSVDSFSSCPPSFPASGPLPMSGLIASGGQRIGASASASLLPINIQVWFPLWLIGLISLQSREFSIAFSSTTVRKNQFFGTLPSLWSNSHIFKRLLEKP